MDEQVSRYEVVGVIQMCLFFGWVVFSLVMTIPGFTDLLILLGGAVSAGYWLSKAFFEYEVRKMIR